MANTRSPRLRNRNYKKDTVPLRRYTPAYPCQTRAFFLAPLLLFAVCNLARHLGVDAESALELSSSKFSRRFRAVEAGAKAAGRDLKEMTLAEMDALWDEAKAREN